jgi:hypothetical protein
MRSRCRLFHRASLVAFALISAAMLAAGCSSSNPAASPTTEDWGSLVGSVSSDRGRPLANIQVHLWTQVDGDRTSAQYDAVTGVGGVYEINEIDLSHLTGSSEDWELYVNRTKSSALPINDDYGTYASIVTIEKGEVTTADAEIIEEGPIEPEQYFD